MCPIRQTVCKALVGRFLQSRRRISRNPAPALSIRPWPFSARPGCKPANRIRTRAQTFCGAAIPRTPALTGHSARWTTPPGANRKHCKPNFLVGRWRNAALSPPVLEYCQEGPLSPGRGHGVTKREPIHASEVSIPNAHPFFRVEHLEAGNVLISLCFNPSRLRWERFASGTI